MLNTVTKISETQNLTTNDIERKYVSTTIIKEFQRTEVKYLAIIAQLSRYQFKNIKYVTINEILEMVEIWNQEVDNKITREDVEECIEIYAGFGMLNRMTQPNKPYSYLTVWQ